MEALFNVFSLFFIDGRDDFTRAAIVRLFLSVLNVGKTVNHTASSSRMMTSQVVLENVECLPVNASNKLASR
jgi:hypothetical protein